MQIEQARPFCDTCCDECTCFLGREKKEKSGLINLLREDVETIFAKDPAARSLTEVLTCYPGLHAIWLHRLAHGLWVRGRKLLARLVSHFSRWMTGIEIHPGAHIGRRFFIDHGMGVVIGETSQIGDDVLVYKGVVLGGVSLEKTKRHPTVGNGAILGSNATVLGPIKVGPGAKIGSGSVVVEEVPPHATVVGVPGQVVKIQGQSCWREPDLHHEELPDVINETLEQLTDRIASLEARLRHIEDNGYDKEVLPTEQDKEWIDTWR